MRLKTKLHFFLLGFVLSASPVVAEINLITPSKNGLELVNPPKEGFRNLTVNPVPERLREFDVSKIGASDLQEDSFFEIDEISCRVPNADSLRRLDEETNWTQCYDQRLKFATPDHSQKVLLQSDQKACNCLRNSKVEAVKSYMNQSLRGNSTLREKNPDLLKHLEEQNKLVPQEELHSILNGMFFQAFTVTGSTETAINYGHHLYTIDPKKDSTTIHGTSFEIKRYHPPKELGLDKTPYPPGQCMSPREYMLTRQREIQISDDSFAKDLSQEIENWDHAKLREQYDNIMHLPYTERETMKGGIEKLKEKLKFLNRNPLIKYALGASEAEESTWLQDKKKDIIGAMKKFLPNGECKDIKSKCSDDYDSALKKIFDDPRLISLIRAEAKKDHMKRTRAKVETDGKLKDGVTQKGIVDLLTKRYGLKTPDSCSAGSNSFECIDTFSAYCKLIDRHANEIESMSNIQRDMTIVDDLDESMADDFNLNFEKNAEFQKYNRKHCGPRKNGKDVASFEDFVRSHCARPSNPGCSKNSSSDYAILNQIWIKNYPQDPNETAFDSFKKTFSPDTPLESLAKNRGKGRAVREMGKREADELSKNSELFNSADGEEKLLSRSQGTVDPSTIKPIGRGDDEGRLSNLSDVRPISETVSQGQNNSGTLFDPMGMNSFAIPQGTSQALADPTKVEHLSEQKRKELLEDWESDLDSWKKAKGEDLSPADKAKEEAMKQEIATLKSLLAKQQELTEQQYKLLNDAIAQKSKPRDERDSDVQKTRAGSQRTPARFEASTRGEPAQEFEPLIGRNPASVRAPRAETSFDESSQQRRGRTSAPSGDSSRDSVAREEAKLVSMRRHNDGSVSIESASQGSSGGNAISLNVSDEQYKMLQANPASLNLDQIEQSIPQEQIKKLEKNGEIIVLLRNGSNPPFEVKLEKKDNKLVYRLRDHKGRAELPVRRVFTREALELELKAGK